MPIHEAAPGIPSRTDYGTPADLPAGQALEYVLQRHKALRAGEHLDLRMGGKGGLHSWAVPKGRMPEPGEKLLAVHQPLHSLPYAEFEGEIPEGYGAGTVAKVDRGNVLVTQAAPDKVRFVVTHSRTPETFTLLKTKDKNWLLVNTTPTVPRVLEQHPKVPYVKIDAEEAESLLKGDHAASAKIDGAAMLYEVLKDKIEAVSYRKSTSGRPIVHTYRMGPLALAGPPPPGTVGAVLKGEAYAVGPGGGAIPASALGGLLNASVAKSRERQRKERLTMRAAVYDVAAGPGGQPAPKDYEQRLRLIHSLTHALPSGGVLHPAETVTDPEEARKLIQQVRMGKHPLTTEGVVFTPLRGPGRPSKLKFEEEHDVHIVDVFPAVTASGPARAGGFTYALKPGGKPVGRVGTGFDRATAEDMLANPEAYKGRVARIRAQEQFPGGAYRVPSLIALHEDLPLAKASAAKTLFQAEIAEVREEQREVLKGLVQEKVDELVPKVEKDLEGRGYKVNSISGSSASYRGNPYIASFKFLLEKCKDPDKLVEHLRKRYSPKFNYLGKREEGHLFSIRGAAPVEKDAADHCAGSDNMIGYALCKLAQGSAATAGTEPAGKAEGEDHIPDATELIGTDHIPGATKMGGLTRTAGGEWSPLARLQLAKQLSDRGLYAEKSLILRQLIRERPDEFVEDSREGHIVGVTHVPTGFRIHLPAKQLPVPLQRPALPKVANDAEREHSCLMLTLPPELVAKVKRIGADIPEDDLYQDDSGKYGREEDPHITVKYGIHSKDPADVKALLKDAGPATLTCGATTLFENEDKPYDVVKVDVESPQLAELNRLISDNLECTDTHPEYHAHATVAYVKKGLGKKYTGEQLSGAKAESAELDFSDGSGDHTALHLGPEKLRKAAAGIGRALREGFMSSSMHEEFAKEAAGPSDQDVRAGEDLKLWALAGLASLGGGAIAGAVLKSKLAKLPTVGRADIGKLVGASGLPADYPVISAPGLDNAAFGPAWQVRSMLGPLGVKLTPAQEKALKKHKGGVVYDPAFGRAGVIGHELGHALVNANPIEGPVQRWVRPILPMAAMPLWSLAMVNPDLPTGYKALASLAAAASHLPTLYTEHRATQEGLRMLERTGMRPAMQARHASSLGMAFGTYGLQAALPLLPLAYYLAEERRRRELPVLV